MFPIYLFSSLATYIRLSRARVQNTYYLLPPIHSLFSLLNNPDNKSKHFAPPNHNTLEQGGQPKKKISQDPLIPQINLLNCPRVRSGAEGGLNYLVAPSIYDQWSLKVGEVAYKYFTLRSLLRFVKAWFFFLFLIHSYSASTLLLLHFTFGDKFQTRHWLISFLLG